MDFPGLVNAAGNVLGPLFWYVVAISILITVHEFGHFWVARRAGVTVKRFSIGFGKPLWLRRGRDGTEYAVSMIPLGGYVAMLDERFEDDPVPPEAAHGAHNRKHPFAKILISFAGPAFNLLLALVLYWAVFVVGKPDYAAVIGTPSGEMARAGFVQGDLVRSADGHPVASWEDFGMAVGIAAAYGRDVRLTGTSPDGTAFERVLALSNLPKDASELEQFRAIGHQPDDRPMVHAFPEPGKPAERAGLAVGDRFVAVGAVPVATAGDFFDQLQAQAKSAPGTAIRFTFERDGQRREQYVTPDRVQVGDREVFRIGISMAPPKSVVTRHGPIRAAGEAWGKTVDTTVRTIVLLKDMVVGALSPKQISGPITIARVAEVTAQDGLVEFLGLLAAISVGLAILNLLPVPILDGGHILYYSIEWIRGRALSERELAAGQLVGLVMVAGLIGLAFYNDFARLLQ